MGLMNKLGVLEPLTIVSEFDTSLRQCTPQGSKNRLILYIVVQFQANSQLFWTTFPLDEALI